MLFPPVAVMSHISYYKTIIIEACENYQKKSYRNRFELGSVQGPISLSVPLVKGKHQQQMITKTKICYSENWTRTHLRTIQSLYSNSAYYIHYIDEIKFILSSMTESLYELNYKTLKYLISVCNIKAKLEESIEYRKKPEGIIDLRNEFKPFQRIDLPEYYQLWQPQHSFISNLSILDVLFHMGPDTPYYLEEVYQCLIKK